LEKKLNLDNAVDVDYWMHPVLRIFMGINGLIEQKYSHEHMSLQEFYCFKKRCQIKNNDIHFLQKILPIEIDGI